MKFTLLVVAVLAAAVVGVLADWLLKTFLPAKPKFNHILAGLLACIILAIIAIAPSLLEISNTPQNNATPILSSSVAQATPTSNAYNVIPSDLIGVGKNVLETKIVNLDGIGSDEIIVRWEYNPRIDSPNLGGLDVFAWVSPGIWKSIFELSELENKCGGYWGEFGTVNLFNDQTRQLVTWLQCGTGSFLALEVYKYQGLGFLERIFKSPGIGDSETQQWMESVPVIVNEQLYISHALKLYKYVWTPDGLLGQENDFDIGSGGVTVDFWMDEFGQPQTSPNSVILKVGQYLYIKKLDKGIFPGDTRIQYENNGVLQIDNAILFHAKQVGTCTIYLWGWENPIISVTVVSQ